MPVKKHTVIFIVGPTAAGKSAVAAFLARRIKGEVISCDSMQVYKLAPVLTQAPGVKETAKAPHHLINFLDAAKNYSAAEFSRRAKSLINDIIRRGRTPIVAGGSGLYVKALVDGLFASPAADEKFRKKMYGLVRRRGSRYLHDRLKESDPAQAALIHPNDARRIVRALEVKNSTGRTMTELKKRPRVYRQSII
jgi:tRNA dimethylallyltransferase